MSAEAMLLDNPLLMKHVRSRLRRAQALPWFIILFVICLCITWAGYAIFWFGHSGAFSALISLQVLILIFIGSAQVSASVAAARASGILDFHRISPFPPAAAALGFLLGAPVREYAMFACTLPFALLSAYSSQGGVLGFVQIELALLFSTLIFHSMALLTTLSLKRPRGNLRGGIGGLIFFFIVFAQSAGPGIWYLTRELDAEETRTLRFFGLPLYWLIFLLLYELPIIGFLFLAAARKMRSDRAHPYTKAEAIACMATMTTLALGAFWGLKHVEFLSVGILYGLVVLGVFLATTVTPDANEYIKGARRALRFGHRRPSPWSDAGCNRMAVVVLSAIVAAGASLAWQFIEGRQPGERGAYSRSIPIGVFVVAYYGFALQYFLLKAPKNGRALMMLFVFVVWLLPLVAGGIAAAALSAPGQDNAWIAGLVVAISPLAGIGMSVGGNVAWADHADALAFAAILPAVTFAFVFNSLLVTAQRRLDRSVRDDEEKRKAAKVEEVAAAV